jgi:hypothetical protein
MTREYRRRGVLVRMCSPAEDALMTEMRIAGDGTTKIARALTDRFGHPRSAATINMRLKALAERDEREDRWP